MRTTGSGKRLGDRGHEQPVAAAKARPDHLALEYLQLMAKGQYLDFPVHQFV
jgi:hypothetical protein